MEQICAQVLEFVKENQVKFIRLAFCDPFGVHKNISIMPEELAGAFTHGVSFDGSAIRGFEEMCHSDLLLFPDPATLQVLPWRPGPGRVIRFYCDVKRPDGQVFERDCRGVLRRAVKRCAEMGFQASVGTECEFYLFTTDENGAPTPKPLDCGGYLDIAPLDKGEDIRREICLCLEEMGLYPETSHHEQGPGQNEIDFRFDSPLECADNLMTFKSVVRSVAGRNGLHASFLPKPLEGKPGSGLHMNLSLRRGGRNLFENFKQPQGEDIAGSFMAGVLRQAPAITAFLNPLENSYHRLGCFEAPRYVSWSHQNRSQLVRIPAAVGQRERMELRSADPMANPYLAIALVLEAGLDGVQEKLPRPASVDLDLFRNPVEGLVQLPATLGEAIALAEESPLVKRVLGTSLCQAIVERQRQAVEAKQPAFVEGIAQEFAWC